MSQIYTNRKRMNVHETAAQQPSLDELRSGAAVPTQAQLGHRVDLPDAMREKMETAFGADLSGVRLYESQTVADAGANAITQGSNIAFAPGMLDFTSFGGQALLGHELSHVVSQARGEVAGSGFLNDHALEARADREGAMAAAGEQIAMPAAPLSSVSAAPAAGPMQADKTDKYRRREIEAFDKSVMTKNETEKEKYRKEYEKYRDKKAARLRKSGADEDAIRADNAETTGYLQQMSRARSRNIGENAGADSYSKYMSDLRNILNTMSDDEIRTQQQVQTGMVDAYVEAHQAGLGAGGRGAFMSGGGIGGDLLGSMYGRMMGRRNIGEAMRNRPDVAVSQVRRMINDSNVAGLLRRQHHRTFGSDPNDASVSNVMREAETMRGFWSNAIHPNSASTGSVEAAQNAAQIDMTLQNDIPDAVVANKYNDMLLGGTYDPAKLNDDTAADYLLQITDTESPMRQQRREEARRQQELIEARRQAQRNAQRAPEPTKPRAHKPPTVQHTLTGNVPTYHDPEAKARMEAEEQAMMEELGFASPTGKKKKKHHHRHHFRH